MSLLADPVVRSLAVPAYYAAIDIVPLLALAAGIYGAYFLVGIGASRVKRTGWHVAVASGAVVVSLIANLLLVPAFGATGAAVAAVCANSALAGLMLIRSQRVFHVDYEVGRIGRAIALTGVAVAAAYLLPTGTDWQSWISRLAAATAWPLVLFVTGFVTPAERLRIGRLVRGTRGAVV
jgi:O-antigen/teichoic acid export membrane protein